MRYVITDHKGSVSTVLHKRTKAVERFQEACRAMVEESGVVHGPAGTSVMHLASLADTADFLNVPLNGQHCSFFTEAA